MTRQAGAPTTEHQTTRRRVAGIAVTGVIAAVVLAVVSVVSWSPTPTLRRASVGPASVVISGTWQTDGLRDASGRSGFIAIDPSDRSASLALVMTNERVGNPALSPEDVVLSVLPVGSMLAVTPSTRRATIDGTSATRYTYSLASAWPPLSATPGQPLDATTYLFVRSGDTYGLTFTSAGRPTAGEQREFDRIVASLRVAT